MRGLSVKFRRFREFVLFFLSLLIVNWGVFFSHERVLAAANSIDACLQQPACASAFADELGGFVNQGFTAGGSSAHYITGAAGLGAGATAIYGANWLDAQRNRAAQNYGHSQTASGGAVPTSAGSAGSITFPYTGTVRLGYTGFQSCSSFLYNQTKDVSVTAGQVVTSSVSPYCPAGRLYPVWFGQATVSNLTYVYLSVTGISWDGLTPDQKAAGVGSISDPDMIGGSTAGTISGTGPVGEPWIFVDPGVLSPDGPIDGPTALPNPAYPGTSNPPATAPKDANGNWASPGYYTDSKGITWYWTGSNWVPLKEAPYVPGDPLPEPQPLSDPNPSPSPSPTPTPTPSPDEPDPDFDWPDSSPPEDCPNCDESAFQNVPNFITYAGTKLSTKFPFDVVGTFSYNTSTCPTLSVQGYSMEMCFVSNSISVLKFPIWFLFTLRMVLHI